MSSGFDKHWDYPPRKLSDADLDQHYDDCIADLHFVSAAGGSTTALTLYLRRLIKEVIRRGRVAHLIKRRSQVCPSIHK